MYNLLSILLFTFGLSVTTEDIYDNSWALIIGIDKYDKVQNLNYAVKDAESIQDILVNSFDFPEDNIILLKNEQATKQNILKSFSDITLNAKEQDRVLIFFAGHGETMDLPDGGEMGYLLPVDGYTENLYLSSIGMDELKKISIMSNAKHLLYLIDACYGGIAAVGARGLDASSTPNYIEKITRNKSRQIITAGGRGEQVIEKSEWGHSAFTKSLKQGLQDGNADFNGDGYITANELGLYLNEMVTIDSENQQTPQVGRMTTQEGEFVFISKEDKIVLANDKMVVKESLIDYDVLAKKIAKELNTNNKSMELKNADTEIIKYFVHISSLTKTAEIYEKSGIYIPFIKGRKLEILSHTFLDSIRKNLQAQLMLEYFESNKEINIPTSIQDINFLKNNNININDFGNNKLVAIDSISDRFDYPNKIITINLFRLVGSESMDGKDKYFYSMVINCALPRKSCWADYGETDFIDVEMQLFTDIRNQISKNKHIGTVESITEDLILVKLNNLKIKKQMILSAGTVFNFTYGNGAEIAKIDCKDGIDYYEGLGDDENDLLIEELQNKCKSLNSLSINAETAILSTAPFNYKLQVIEVIDSIAITKRINITKPFVKVRIGDEVKLDY